MKSILLADTHIKPGQSLLERLPAELISLLKRTDVIIHAGDFETLECYDELRRLGNVVAVHGDTDSAELMELLPERDIIEMEGVSVGIIHRGQLTSEHTDGLGYLAREMDVNVLIFGHFHHPIVEKNNVLLLSPGSATVPGIAEPSAMELEIIHKRITGKIIRCTGRVCGHFAFEAPR